MSCATFSSVYISIGVTWLLQAVELLVNELNLENVALLRPIELSRQFASLMHKSENYQYLSRTIAHQLGLHEPA